MIRRPRVAHVVAGLAPVYGGPSYSVPRLCRALAEGGADLTLLSVAAAAETAGEACAGAYRDCRFAQDYAKLPLLGRLRCSASLSQALRAATPQFDLVHDHGLWLMPNLEAGWATARLRKPLVVSPRGMLSAAALAFSRTRKRAFWRLLQGPALRHAACFHATSAQEYDEIRAFGLTAPVAIIPNGVDLPPAAGRSATAGAARCVLSLGRLHPKKGLDRLLRVWAVVEPRFPDWRLRLVGPDEAGHSEALRGLARRLNLQHATIAGPLYDDAKAEAYRSADLFVLASRNENFGLTVAEALAAGTPVISTKGAPWQRLEAEGCGWWVDDSEAMLAAALAGAMTLPPASLREMGERGRAWMAREFSWQRAAQDMLTVYRWLLEGGSPPPMVRFA